MISIIKKSIIYFVIVAFVAFTIIFVYSKISPLGFFSTVDENKIMEFKVNRSNQDLRPYSNLILGDSRSMVGLNPLLLKHNFINFSLSGGTPIEAYLMLKNILKRNKIDTVMISFGVFHFIRDDIANIAIYNHLMNDEDLKNIEFLEKKYNISVKGEKLNKLIYDERKLIASHNILAFRSYFLSSIGANLYNNNPQISTVKSNLGFQLFNNKDSSVDVTKDFEFYLSKQPTKLNLILFSYLDSIHSICLEKHIKPIYIIFPFNQASQKILYNTYYPNRLSKFKIDLHKRFPLFQIYDKYEFLPNTYFGDPQHLNKKGSDFFTTDFKNNFLENDLNVK